MDSPEPMANLETFRRRLLDEKYPESSDNTAVRSAVMQLSAARGIDLLAGENLYADGPKIGVWRIGLDRGSGFYFDACFAITDFTTISTVLIDSVSPSAQVQTYNMLAGFPANTPLW
ncbi:hypothetical protein [Mesorhizobium huakuii]|uniref:Uncharacterized protein n=1 Tax=Mesorhizobium huakuii TaxID=28104 RepID=A0A7G6SZA5_9HYPH|nr:hypothetical protein [Mesorhizobium huakuii]QND59837.1 hypothetical protein HB778_27235 [Mesorhizobium huakuii]